MDSNLTSPAYDENNINILRRCNSIILSRTDDCTHELKCSAIEDFGYMDVETLNVERLETKWREVYHVRFNRGLEFVPGDSIGLLCPNSEDLVEEMMKILGIEDFGCRIERKGLSPFIYTGRIEKFFRYYFDFTSLPRRSMLSRLCKTCGEEKKREMEYLCSRAGTREYLDLGSQWRNVIDIIRLFECKPTLEDILCECEILKPRCFSLINGVGEDAEIIVGVMSKVSEGAVRYGHVSKHFVFGGNGTTRMYLRRNNLFRMRNDGGKILAICTGTGIAPFISFMKSLKSHQKMWMLYGFRNDEDDILQCLLPEVNQRIKITKIRSSDGVHVTDYIRENVEEVQTYVDSECLVYVCGRMDMQRDVFEQFIREMKNVVEEKRLIFDNWS